LKEKISSNKFQKFENNAFEQLNTGQYVDGHKYISDSSLASSNEE
jgi:hypothetical protein